MQSVSFKIWTRVVVSISYDDNHNTTSTSWRKWKDKSQNTWMQQTSTEYKTRQKWVGKLIYFELRKKLNFDHTSKWHINKQESV